MLCQKYPHCFPRLFWYPLRENSIISHSQKQTTLFASSNLQYFFLKNKEI